MWREGGSLHKGQVFINDTGQLKRGNGQEGKGELERKRASEIEVVLKWSVKKFGRGRMQDAREAWVRPSDRPADGRGLGAWLL